MKLMTNFFKVFEHFKWMLTEHVAIVTIQCDMIKWTSVEDNNKKKNGLKLAIIEIVITKMR